MACVTCPCFANTRHVGSEIGQLRSHPVQASLGTGRQGNFRARCHRPRRFLSGGSEPQELGIPTANLDRSCLHGQLAQAVTGIYGGWAAIGHSSTVYPMVMSVGFNPFYGNKVPSVLPGHSPTLPRPDCVRLR